MIFQVGRYFEKDLDRASDCFQFVCEKLSEDRFRRLLRFKPQGTASFSTWLRAVVRKPVPGLAPQRVRQAAHVPVNLTPV